LLCALPGTINPFLTIPVDGDGIGFPRDGGGRGVVWLQHAWRENPMFKKILAPLDGSPNDDIVLDHVKKLAKQFSSAVTRAGG
jgi:hypothetical protein